jgi:hypothetical protein
MYTATILTIVRVRPRMQKTGRRSSPKLWLAQFMAGRRVCAPLCSSARLSSEAEMSLILIVLIIILLLGGGWGYSYGGWTGYGPGGLVGLLVR